MGSLLAERMDQAVDESRARNQMQGFDDPDNLVALGTLRMRLRRETFLSDAAVKYDAATRLETMPAPIDDPD